MKMEASMMPDTSHSNAYFGDPGYDHIDWVNHVDDNGSKECAIGRTPGEAGAAGSASCKSEFFTSRTSAQLANRP